MSISRGEPGWLTQFRRRALDDLDLGSVARWCGTHVPRLDLERIARAPVGSGEPDVGADPHEVIDEVVVRRGVVLCDLSTAALAHAETVRQHLGNVVPPGDGLAALNATLWSSGTFVFVPPGVAVDLTARTDQRTADRFRRTLIVAAEGSSVRYLHGCVAPAYSAEPLRSEVVEVVVGAGAHVVCTTIQNWSPHVVNVVEQRAFVDAGGRMTWIDGDIGARHTIKSSSVELRGPGASGRVLSVPFAGDGQQHEIGAEFVHSAPNTTSELVSRAIGWRGGAVSHPWVVRTDDRVVGVSSSITCDALIVEGNPRLSAGPTSSDAPGDVAIDHRATVARISDQQRFYLQSRGLSVEQATAVVINGFIEPVVRNLPMEYALEWARLVELQVAGAVG